MFWLCIPWCNQPSAGHVRSSLWPYGGTTGHPFLKLPPWSSSSRAPLQHPALKHGVLGNSTIMGHYSTIYDIDGWFPQQKKNIDQWIGLREILQENPYSMGKSMVSCRFSLKPIHWQIDDHRDRCQELRRPNGRGGTAGAFGIDWKIPSNK